MSSDQFYALAIEALTKFGFLNCDIELCHNRETVVFYVTNRATTTRHSYSLRIYSQSIHNLSNLQSALFWLESIHLSGVIKVPRPIANCSGSFILELTSQLTTEHMWCCLLEWLPGQPVACPPHIDTLKAIGEALARLHAHTNSLTPPQQIYKFRSVNWEGLFGHEAVFKLSVPSLLERLPLKHKKSARQILASAQESFAALTGDHMAQSFVHGDFHLGNILIDCGRVSIIDFDFCGIGFPAYDCAILISDLVEYPDAVLYVKAFLEGYRNKRALPFQSSDVLLKLIRARRLWIGLWALDRAVFIPALQEECQSWVEYAFRELHFSFELSQS